MLIYSHFIALVFSKDENKIERVKMCECKLIDLLFNYDQELAKIKEYEDKTVEGVVSSETVGKHSISYQKASLRSKADVEKERSKKIKELIHKNLFMTGLLYSGLSYV